MVSSELYQHDSPGIRPVSQRNPRVPHGARVLEMGEGWPGLRGARSEGGRALCRLPPMQEGKWKGGIAGMEAGGGARGPVARGPILSCPRGFSAAPHCLLRPHQRDHGRKTSPGRLAVMPTGWTSRRVGITPEIQYLCRMRPRTRPSIAWADKRSRENSCLASSGKMGLASGRKMDGAPGKYEKGAKKFPLDA